MSKLFFHWIEALQSENLQHEVGNDTMEDRALVVQRFP